MSFGRTNYRTGGTRGGADQFKWEDVKNDKYRENYLGHSLQAPVGRWQKGKDLTWYAKASKADRAAALESELALAKQRDEDLMNEALGIAPRKRPNPTGQLDAAEMKELLKRGESERDTLNVERVEGLGAAPVAASGFESAPKKTLAQRYQDALASGKQDDTYALPGTLPSANGDTQQASGQSNDAKLARKQEKAARKAAKKQKKKEKKEKKAKKEQRQEKKRKKHSDESDQRGRSWSCSSSSSRSRSPPRFRSRSSSPLPARSNRNTRSLSRDRSPPMRRATRSRSRSFSPSTPTSYRRSKHSRRQHSRSRSYDRHRRRSRSGSLRRRSQKRSRSRSRRR